MSETKHEPPPGAPPSHVLQPPAAPLSHVLQPPAAPPSQGLQPPAAPPSQVLQPPAAPPSQVLQTPAAPPSQVLQTPAAPSDEARRHFQGKLAFETDPSDVHHDLRHGGAGIVVVDARGPAAYAEMRVPGAINLPPRAVHEANAGALRGKLVVVYCWAASCNAAAKAAVKLSALGLPVKEMIGGLDAWVREGYPVEGAFADGGSFDEYLRRHHAVGAASPARGGQ